jgi:hypothetical protein
MRVRFSSALICLTEADDTDEPESGAKADCWGPQAVNKNMLIIAITSILFIFPPEITLQNINF